LLYANSNLHNIGQLTRMDEQLGDLASI
jgi:hypothetical protein